MVFAKTNKQTNKQKKNNTIASLNKAIEFMKGPQLYVGEGNGTPLQYPCLENPMDGEAW